MTQSTTDNSLMAEPFSIPSIAMQTSDECPASRSRWSIMLAWLLLASVLCGCSRTGYPEVSATSYRGKAAQCHQCGKTIESVTAENERVFLSGSFIVCSESCATELKQWNDQNNGISN